MYCVSYNIFYILFYENNRSSKPLNLNIYAYICLINDKNEAISKKKIGIIYYWVKYLKLSDFRTFKDI